LRARQVHPIPKECSDLIAAHALDQVTAREVVVKAMLGCR
jgi:hypothetical protein